MARTDPRVLFDEIPDPRVQRTRRHRLTDVLVLVLLGTVVGCPGWDAIKRFAYEREREQRDILALPGGIPSADMASRHARRSAPASATANLGSRIPAWSGAGTSLTLSGPGHP